MKTKLNITVIIRATLLAATACGFVSCASFEHPLARHDMDGDGAISHPEYQQNHMQYNLADRQRYDELDRAQNATRHMANVGDFVYQTDRVLGLVSNLGN